MDINLTFSTLLALFGVMLVGALIPGVSVLTVSARTAALGFSHGVSTTLGIVAGDIIFILIAILGLVMLAETLGELFIFIKYLGGAYLVWLGVILWQSRLNTTASPEEKESSLLSSFMAGLLITLADQKAILFYLGFFPAFVDLTTLTAVDTLIIIAMAFVAICSAKLTYAYFATRASFLFGEKIFLSLNHLTGSILLGIGLFLIIKTILT